MKKITIGIPRSLYYYNYGILWKSFFNHLGCKVIISPETDEKIVKSCPNNILRRECLPYHIYIGHVMYLQDKCDYILITKICDSRKNKKVCPKYQLIVEELKKEIPKEQILLIDIDPKKMKYHELQLIKMAFKITKNPIKIIYSYIKAISKQEKYNITKQNEIRNKLSNPQQKILLVSMPYILQDKYITFKIYEILKANNISIIYSNYLSHKTALFFSTYFSNNLKYILVKELVGAIYYYKYQVDGIIMLSDKYCNFNNFTKEMIKKENNIKIINIDINNSEDYLKEITTFIASIKEKDN